ncbi:response regulator transcription factor [Bacillota bacterium LX-D]|nr:response regulator transcription factor [Bacillota bacterium LX-D]
MGQKILVVDDEPSIVELVKFNLENANFCVEEAATGNEALEKVKKENFALIILDIMLPGVDGLEVCRRIRQQSQVPILMLSARVEEFDRVLGLELGADDYLTKPFSPRELIARVKAILRRVDESKLEAKEQGIALRGLTILPEQHKVLVKGQEIELTLTEYRLLELMLQSPGRVFSREYLLETVWGIDYFGDARNIDVHIRHLREKIEPDPANPQYIITVRGIGYKFREKDLF